MKDQLLDLVQHTIDLGTIEQVKIIGTDKETALFGVAVDKSVIMEGKFAGPVAEFIGTFGMPNLAKIKIILNTPEYKEDATLSITSRDDGTPEQLNIVNKAGDFKNSYRFMPTATVMQVVKTTTFKGATWHVECEPTVGAIQRLKMQAAANAEEVNFQARTDNGDLKIFFGDPSTHAGNFVFQPGVTGTLKRAWAWPVKTIINILDLYGDKTFKISDDGVAMITVNSGLATYNYIIPAQSK